MLSHPADWTSEAYQAAEEEAKKRNLNPVRINQMTSVVAEADALGEARANVRWIHRLLVVSLPFDQTSFKRWMVVCAVIPWVIALLHWALPPKSLPDITYGIITFSVIAAYCFYGAGYMRRDYFERIRRDSQAKRKK